VIVWVLGILYTLVKGRVMNSVGSTFIDLDLLTILTAYLFLFHGPVGAGIFAFWQGSVIDLFSGGAYGIFALLYLCVFGGIALGSQYVNPQHRRGLMLLVTLAVLLKRGLFMAIVKGSQPEADIGGATIWIAVASAVVTGLVAPFIFFILNKAREISTEDGPTGPAEA